MDKFKFEVDFWPVVFLVALVLFHGEPDIVDAIVYKMTGVWQTTSGLLSLDK